jgi:hypothetical protein
MAKTTKTTKTEKAPEPTALTPEQTSDLQTVLETGALVTAFLKKAAAFFLRASIQTERAQKALDLAKAYPKPTDEASDLKAQTFIKASNTLAGEIETDWNVAIASPLYKLHRWSTGKRDLGANAAKEAARLVNAQHNAYVADEKRRAELERQRLQKIEDDKAAAARQKELDDLEAKALEAEASTEQLSEREQFFVDRVALGTTPYEAAKYAGYKHPADQAARLVTLGKIVDAIEAKRSAAALRQQAAATAAAPVKATVVDVKPNVAKAAGTREVTRWKAIITNPEALIAAVFAGDVPRDVLCIDEARLNQYARDLTVGINQWPGVQADSTTKVE